MTSTKPTVLQQGNLNAFISCRMNGAPNQEHKEAFLKELYWVVLQLVLCNSLQSRIRQKAIETFPMIEDKNYELSNTQMWHVRFEYWKAHHLTKAELRRLNSIEFVWD